MNPHCLVLAGPNGAGKSSFYKHLSPLADFINADQLAAEMRETHPNNTEFAAGREAMRRIDAHLDTRQSFVFETTLGGQQPLKMMQRARDCGFHVAIVFVALSSAELHVARVAQRVSQGGHNIEATLIRRRYMTAFDNLELALPIAHETALYDNSARSGFRLCALVSEGQVVENHLLRRRRFDQRIAACLSRGLGIPVAELLGGTTP